MEMQKSFKYIDFYQKWETCRDVISGEYKVKKKRTKYLPKASGMTEEDYNGYITRAKFFNATGRTAEGLHGMMFRKPVEVNVPEKLQQYLDKVDKFGNNIQQFIQDVVWDTIITNWSGVLIDYPNVSNVSKKIAEDNGYEPFCTFYKAESIYQWRWNTDTKENYLDLIILHETEEVISDDGYSVNTIDVYRILEIDEEGYYKQTVKRSDDITDISYYPEKNGERLKRIPFYFLPDKEPFDPMMLNLACINLAWYRKSADLENGLHWTGVPTPYIIGYEAEERTDEIGNTVAKEEIKLGGTICLLLPETVTQIGYLEFSGAGLSQLQNEMQSDEERMAILGARIISAEKRGVESADAARIHRAGENSVLAAFANNLSRVFSQIFKDYLEWCSNQELSYDDVKITINTDYDSGTIDYGILTNLISLVQQGKLSMRNLYRVMQKGEIGIDYTSFEQNQMEIEEENGGLPPKVNQEE